MELTISPLFGMLLTFAVITLISLLITIKSLNKNNYPTAYSFMIITTFFFIYFARTLAIWSKIWDEKQS